MTDNPYVAQLAKSEKIYAAELGKLLTKSLQAKDVQKNADAKTLSSSPGKVPPKPIHQVFQAALKKALKSLPKKYQTLEITPNVSYQQKGTSWIATVTVDCAYVMKSVGGGSYTVKPGDTLWAIAKEYYGHGMYWPAIAEYNAKAVASKGNFILAGVKLQVPQIQIPAVAGEVEALKKVAKATSDAKKPAVCVMFPTLEFDLEKGSSITTILKGPGVTIRVTTTLKGNIKAQKTGALPGSFNLRTYETELSDGLKPFQSSVKFKGFKLDSIAVASNVSGTTWKTSISVTKKGTFKLSISPKPVSFKNKKIVYEGKVGLEMEVQIIPDPIKVPEPKYVQVFDWVADNAKVVAAAAAGATLIVGAGVIAGGTIVEDVLTGGAGIADDPASFAAASAMFGTGMQLIH